MLIVFLVQTVKGNPVVIYLLVGLVFVSILIEAYMQKVKKRTIKSAVS